MKIILLREKGRSHSIRVLRRTLIVGLLCLSLLTTVGGTFVFQGLTRDTVGGEYPDTVGPVRNLRISPASSGHEAQ